MRSQDYAVEETIFAFRKAATEAFQRNVQHGIQRNRKEYLPFSTYLPNTDAYGCLTSAQIREIVQTGRKDLFQEQGLFRKLSYTLCSVFSRSPKQSEIGETLSALEKAITLEQRIERNLQGIRSQQTASSPSLAQELTARVARLEQQRTRIATSLSLSSSASKTILTHFGYTLPAEKPSPVASVTSVVPLSYSFSSFPRFAYGFAVGITASVIGFCGYFLPAFASKSYDNEAGSIQTSIRYAPISQAQYRAPSLPLPPKNPPIDNEALLPQAKTSEQQNAGHIYGYGKDERNFITLKNDEQQIVAAAIDSWNNTPAPRWSPSSSNTEHSLLPYNGIYKIENRTRGLAEFLFVENGSIKGTGSYRTDQPRFI